MAIFYNRWASQIALAATLVLFTTAGSVAAGEGASDKGNKNSPQAIAIFAGGCFWCMEKPYDVLDGVLSTTSGYIGGELVSPTYKEVSAGNTGHAEAVQIVYDPQRVDYETLLDVFWRNVDPLDIDGQFCDRGNQYRPAVFYMDDSQKVLAERSKEELEASGRFISPILTEIVEATDFYPAEDYHQDYYKENPTRYKFYRYSCGRDKRLQELWGKETGGRATAG